MKKKWFIAALAVVLTFACSVPVLAAPAPAVENPLVTADFDLSTRMAQEETIVLPNGETAILGAAPVAAPCAGSNSYPGATGTWRVYYSSGLVNAEYHISISSASRITNVWNPMFSIIGGSVSGSSLTFTSTQATGWWDVYLVEIFSHRAFLWATMNGTILVVSWN